ncbi:uncharacterized protein ATNIH1004_009318 [Aspergillus tanneri]|uniref:Uncharacterized protein n=1 Tax=Aspergillus tanneri TaxID=1220188 RepID=A0A5M9MJG4_9EURO|nr:uncharacterized protein ATNIH1004_009318 [Aspergillus tanneri]KAA8645103.1 hypothetical protein ATNIH1004_009318 [Aspergillus tanneri]
MDLNQAENPDTFEIPPGSSWTCDGITNAACPQRVMIDISQGPGRSEKHTMEGGGDGLPMIVDHQTDELQLDPRPFPRQCTLRFQFLENGRWQDSRVWDERTNDENGEIFTARTEDYESGDRNDTVFTARMSRRPW